jgi:hypothetical protein
MNHLAYLFFFLSYTEFFEKKFSFLIYSLLIPSSVSRVKSDRRYGTEETTNPIRPGRSTVLRPIRQSLHSPPPLMPNDMALL